MLLIRLGHNRLAHLLFILLFVLFAAPAWAQQTATVIRISPEDQDRGLNGPQKNFYFATGGDQKFQNAGFFGQKLRPYVADNPEALKNLNRYRRQKWLYLSERIVFLSSLSLYSQQVLAKDEKQYFSQAQRGAIGVAAFSLLANVLISRNTNEHFRRTVEAYNAGQPAARTGALQRLTPSAVGFTAVSKKPQLALTWSLR